MQHRGKAWVPPGRGRRARVALVPTEETEQRLSLGEDQWSWAFVSGVHCRAKGQTAHWSSPSPQTAGLSRGTSGTRCLHAHGCVGRGTSRADASTLNRYRGRAPGCHREPSALACLFPRDPPLATALPAHILGDRLEHHGDHRGAGILHADGLVLEPCRPAVAGLEGCRGQHTLLRRPGSPCEGLGQ